MLSKTSLNGLNSSFKLKVSEMFENQFCLTEDALPATKKTKIIGLNYRTLLKTS